MKKKDLEREIEELRRRIEDLERRPVYVPYPWIPLQPQKYDPPPGPNQPMVIR